jgi:hypothetical protein
VLSGSQLNGPVRVIAGADNDDVTLSSSYIHGLLDIRTSSGQDEINVTSVLVGGRFFADTGDDNDTVLIARWNNSASTFEGITTVRTGRGDDFMGIGMFTDPNIFGHFRAPALLDGGPGNDGLNYKFNGNLFDDGLTEAGWETVT